METGIRLLLFFMSNAGYYIWIRRKLNRINRYFIPSVIIAFQHAVLFIAGILNVLLPVTVSLFIAGIILSLYTLIQEKKQFPKKSMLLSLCRQMRTGDIWFLIAVPVLLLAVKGHVFAHYDEFSHWGLAVQDMLITDRFPNFERTRIGFQAYPLGASVYAYYVSRIVSISEPVQMFAQGYMELCFILPVFSFVGKMYRTMFTVLFTLAVNIVLCMNIPVTSLLTDTVLPLAGAAGFLWIMYYHMQNKECSVEFYAVLALYFVLVSQIKNSGIFFVMISGSFLMYLCRKDGWSKARSAAALLAPLLSLALWKSHCAYVFSNSAASKHAMDLESYIRQYSMKSQADIVKIMKNILTHFCHEKILFGVMVFVSIIFVLLFYSCNDKHDACCGYADAAENRRGT